MTLILQIDENQNLQELKIKKIWHWLFSSCLPSRVHGGLEAKRSSIRGDSGSKVSDTNPTSFDGNATFIVIPGTRGRPAAVPDPQRESDPPLHIHRQTFFFFFRESEAMNPQRGFLLSNEIQTRIIIIQDTYFYDFRTFFSLSSHIRPESASQ